MELGETWHLKAVMKEDNQLTQLDLLESLAVALHSGFLMPFLDWGRWMEAIFGSAWVHGVLPQRILNSFSIKQILCV